MYYGIDVIRPVWERRDYHWVDAFHDVTMELDGWKASFEDKNGEELVSEWDRACCGEGEYTGNEEEEEEAEGIFTSDEMEEEKEDD